MVESQSLSNDRDISLGKYLKKVRAEKLISVEEIASVTKISLNLLNALENDSLEDLPAAPFVKGFIKSYAKYVGIDPKIALNIYEQSKPLAPSENQPIDKLSERKGISLNRLRMSKYSYLMITVVLIFSLTVFALLIIKGLKNGGVDTMASTNSSMVINIKNSNEQNSTSVNGSNIASSALSYSTAQPATTPLAQIDMIVSQATGADVKQPEATIASPVVETNPADTETVSENDGKETKETTDITDKDTADDVKVNEQQTLEQKILNQNVVEKEQIVDIIAKDNVWVKVQTDDTAPYDFMLKTGQIKVIKAEKEIKMLFGDAGAVSLKYNGRVIETLGEKGAVRSLVFPSFSRWKGEKNVQ